MNARFLIVGLVLAACATKYQRAGSGIGPLGYKDQALGRDKYWVEFAANQYTSIGQVNGYLVRRTDEICSGLGYDAAVFRNHETRVSYAKFQMQCTGKRFRGAEGGTGILAIRVKLTSPGGTQLIPVAITGWYVDSGAKTELWEAVQDGGWIFLPTVGAPFGRATATMMIRPSEPPFAVEEISLGDGEGVVIEGGLSPTSFSANEPPLPIDLITIEGTTAGDGANLSVRLTNNSREAAEAYVQLVGSDEWSARLRELVGSGEAADAASDAGFEDGAREAHACRLNSDCSDAEACVDSVCTLACRTDRDCPEGEVCTTDTRGIARCEP